MKGRLRVWRINRLSIMRIKTIIQWCEWWWDRIYSLGDFGIDFSVSLRGFECGLGKL